MSWPHPPTPRPIAAATPCRPPPRRRRRKPCCYPPFRRRQQVRRRSAASKKAEGWGCILRGRVSKELPCTLALRRGQAASEGEDGDVSGPSNACIVQRPVAENAFMGLPPPAALDAARPRRRHNPSHRRQAPPRPRPTRKSRRVGSHHPSFRYLLVVCPPMTILRQFPICMRAASEIAVQAPSSPAIAPLAGNREKNTAPMSPPPICLLTFTVWDVSCHNDAQEMSERHGKEGLAPWKKPSHGLRNRARSWRITPTSGLSESRPRRQPSRRAEHGADHPCVAR